MKVRELLNKGRELLKKSGFEEYAVNAEMLFMYAAKVDKTWTIINSDAMLDDKVVKKYYELLARRVKGEPVQYIINEQCFMGLDFYVDENVLVPRYDTECLVEEVLNYAKGKDIDAVLDVCTGSGAIAVSIAHLLDGKSNTRVYATDISLNAINVASKNAKLNNVSDKITFLVGDMFEPLKILRGSLVNDRNDEIKDVKCYIGNNNSLESGFDIIVSNPPYIKTSVISTLSKDVKFYEPHIALDGGYDGLNFYRLIAQNAHEYLRDSGLLALEIGHDQGNMVKSLLENDYTNIQIKQDLAGLDRVVLAQKK